MLTLVRYAKGCSSFFSCVSTRTDVSMRNSILKGTLAYQVESTVHSAHPCTPHRASLVKIAVS